MRITVIGTGYVGSVTGTCLAYLGHHVTCVDTDHSKIAKWQRDEPPIHEPCLQELVALASQRNNLEFSTDLRPAVRSSDVIFIAVGTPPLPDGSPDLTYLETAGGAIGAAINDARFRVVVNKSTVPVGSGNLVETLVREGASETDYGTRNTLRIGVASNPEFLREGCAVADSLYLDRIVLGASDQRTLSILLNLYRPIIEQSFIPPRSVPRPPCVPSVPLVSTTLTSAEMIKYAANAFLTMKIGFANEIANLCERLGGEAGDVMSGIGLDSRIGSRFLNPGVGWGGSCFGKDIQALLQTAGEYGCASKLLQAALEVNTAQRQVVIQKLQEKPFVLKGRTIGLLGLSFKPDTDDLRDAPALHIAERLNQISARVKAYDPVAMEACRRLYPELKIRYCSSVRELAQGADALLLVTEWKEFASLPLRELASLMAQPVLIDGRNLFRPEAAAAAGFDYSGIGRGPRPFKGYDITENAVTSSAYVETT